MGNKNAKANSTSREVKSLVEHAISTYPVVIFSKTYCPYCISAKNDIRRAGTAIAAFAPPKIFELDTMGSEGRAIQAYLAGKTGRRTVPNVFIGGVTVGGGDEIAAFSRRNVLKQMLTQAPDRLAASRPVPAPAPDATPAFVPATAPVDSPKQVQSVQAFVEQTLKENPVVIFSKSFCPYCKQAKADIATACTSADGCDGAKVIELDMMGERGNEIHSYVIQKTGHQTVPNVFIGGVAVGGGDQVAALAASGQLVELISAAVQASSSADTSVSTVESAADVVEEALKENPVVIFSKSFCPYCKQAKADIASACTSADGCDGAKIFELDRMGERGNEIHSYVIQKTGRQTVPNVFIAGAAVGGGDQVAALAASGQLIELMAAAVRKSSATPSVASETVVEKSVPPASPAQKLVEEAVAANPVVVFSKTWCPFCVSAKSKLARTCAELPGFQPPKVFELDTMGDFGGDVQMYLFQKTGQRTVPSVFIGGKPVGGGDDISGYLARGELKQMLTDAPAALGLASQREEDRARKPALKEIVFGAGCFWGVELAFQRVIGVVNTEVGYSNGRLAQVSYDAVCSGLTGSAEVVRVTYDPAVVTLAELLALWEKRHNPTSLNRQGNDSGTQYRSAVYYNDEEQKAEIEKWRSEASFRLSNPIVSEIDPIKNYCPAEGYHQRYLEKKGQSAKKGSTAHIRCYG